MEQKLKDMIEKINEIAYKLKQLVDAHELGEYQCMNTKFENRMFEFGKIRDGHSLQMDIFKNLTFSVWSNEDGTPWMVDCSSWTEYNFNRVLGALDYELDKIGKL